MSANTYDVDSDYAAPATPEAVLALMADVLDAALASNSDVVHPGSVLGRTVPANLAVPPGPGSLVHSVGLVGALAALGSLEPVPDRPLAYPAWLSGVTERLRGEWRGRPGAEEVIAWIARALSFDPAVRPEPRALSIELAIARTRALRTPAVAPRTVLPDAKPRPPLAPAGSPRVLLGTGTASLLIGATLVLSAALCLLGAAIDRLAGSYGTFAAPIAPAAAPPPAAVVEFSPSPPMAAPSAAPPPELPETPFGATEALPLGPPAALESKIDGKTEVAPKPMQPRFKSEPPKVVPGRDLRDPWNR